jgi:hypothetical protein
MLESKLSSLIDRPYLPPNPLLPSRQRKRVQLKHLTTTAVQQTATQMTVGILTTTGLAAANTPKQGGTHPIK